MSNKNDTPEIREKLNDIMYRIQENGKLLRNSLEELNQKISERELTVTEELKNNEDK